MALSLVQLIEIRVKNCPMLEQVIASEGAEKATISVIMLPGLRIINLESCSNLTSFFLGSDKMECLSLKEITVKDCPKMFEFTSVFPRKKDMETIDGVNASFFNNKVSCPNLEKLNLFSLNIQKIWPDDQQQATSSNVQNLYAILVDGCHNLKYLFLSPLVENLVQLNQLRIADCKNVEEVIYTGRAAEEKGMAHMLLPNLQILIIANLPKLVRFCNGNYFVFSSLRKLWILGCHVLNTFISANSLIGDDEPQIAQHEGNNSNPDVVSLFSEKVAFPSLKELKIIRMGKWRKIWDDELINVDSFWKLSIVSVEVCEQLLTVFPFKMMKILEKLEELDIMHCESLEEIIGPDHGLNSSSASDLMRGSRTQLIEAESTTKFVFPKMRKLGLQKLPKLKCFYSNTHTTEWPSLQELRVIGCECDKLVEIFAEDKYLNFLERQGESNFEITVQQQPLFWVNEGVGEATLMPLFDSYLWNRLDTVTSQDPSPTKPSSTVVAEKSKSTHEQAASLAQGFRYGKESKI
ncbi:hypothetical protein COLO4_13566 [Corchorus olitorius]|uniref:Disease resistance protein At4g27190-like leucine-rich repeats domain-containing protein n=1 Tax=Corchorus olitorius TaxID=93759 RepID=A0A1R3JW04_9ROSI|nr:hypothetical protein COLO4_13566 [Corchorus olitorius]